MSKSATKVFIKVETDAEQQQNIAKSKKSLKFLQKNNADKENVTRSPFCPIAKNVTFAKSKSADIDSIVTIPESLKRKQIETKTSATQTEAHNLKLQKQITAEDLTTSENPGEHYWEKLAEQRRQALEDTLDENKQLYERIDLLEQELDTSRKMLDEAKNLVEILTEMIEEKEDSGNAELKDLENEKINPEEQERTPDKINHGASTSGGDSCYFEATNSLSNIAEDSESE